MPRASKINGRKEKDLSEYETYSDRLMSAIFAHVSAGGYVGVAHSYSGGLRLYASYEDEREQFQYDNPDHLSLVEEELRQWRSEILEARQSRNARGGTSKGRSTRSGA